MSIFNIFKRKRPISVTVKVLGKEYNVKPSEMTDHPNSGSRQAFRAEMDERRRQADFHNRVQTVFWAMAVYGDFKSSSQFSYPSDKDCEDLFQSVDKLKEIAGDADYSKFVEAAKKEYEKVRCCKPNAEQLQFVLNPDEFDVHRMICRRWSEYAHAYKNYWEEQITGLKRKFAVEKRRKYLVDTIHGRLIPKLHSLGLNDEAVELEQYAKYNEDCLQNQS